MPHGNVSSGPGNVEPRPRDDEFSSRTRTSSYGGKAEHESRVKITDEAPEERQARRASKHKNGTVAHDENTRNNSNGEAKNTTGSFNPSKICEGVLQSCTEVSTDKTLIVKILLFVFALCWLFVIISTSISQLDILWGGCYTFWGLKNKCSSLSYTMRTQLIPCDPLKERLQVGAAFSIFTILILTVVVYLVFRVMMNQRLDARNKRSTAELKPSKWIIAILVAAAEVCELLCWTMVASIYTSRFCEGKKTPRTTTYGPGFALLLTAWILGAIALVVIIVLL